MYHPLRKYDLAIYRRRNSGTVYQSLCGCLTSSAEPTFSDICPPPERLPRTGKTRATVDRWLDEAFALARAEWESEWNSRLESHHVYCCEQSKNFGTVTTCRQGHDESCPFIVGDRFHNEVVLNDSLTTEQEAALQNTAILLAQIAYPGHSRWDCAIGSDNPPFIAAVGNIYEDDERGTITFAVESGEHPTKVKAYFDILHQLVDAAEMEIDR